METAKATTTTFKESTFETGPSRCGKSLGLSADQQGSGRANHTLHPASSSAFLAASMVDRSLWCGASVASPTTWKLNKVELLELRCSDHWKQVNQGLLEQLCRGRIIESSGLHADREQKRSILRCRARPAPTPRKSGPAVIRTSTRANDDQLQLFPRPAPILQSHPAATAAT